MKEKQYTITKVIRDLCWFIAMSIVAWGVFCFLIPWIDGVEATGVKAVVTGVSLVLLYLSGVMVALSAFLSLLLFVTGLVEVWNERETY